MSRAFPVLLLLTISALLIGHCNSGPSALVEILRGEKTELENCSYPEECIEPLYCLETLEGGAKCVKKACKGQNDCIIGQQCSGSGLCESLPCSRTSSCPQNLPCASDGFCTSKGSGGDICTKDDQCWSSNCSNGKCTQVNLVTNRYKPLAAWAIAVLVLASILILFLIALVIMLCLRLSSK